MPRSWTLPHAPGPDRRQQTGPMSESRVWVAGTSLAAVDRDRAGRMQAAHGVWRVSHGIARRRYFPLTVTPRQGCHGVVPGRDRDIDRTALAEMTFRDSAE